MSDSADASDVRGVFPVAALPDEIVDAIVALAPNHSLNLSRYFRDRVLSQLSVIRQNGRDVGKRAAAFLDRACKAAPQGLTLKLGFQGIEDDESALSADALEEMMVKALNSKWEKVEELHVMGHRREHAHGDYVPEEQYFSSCKGYPLTYVGMAFPRLRHLRLSFCNVNHSLFMSLQSCRQLQRLELHATQIDQRCVAPAAEALGRIGSLRDLDIAALGDLNSTYLTLLRHLPGFTTLTRLVLNSFWDGEHEGEDEDENVHAGLDGDAWWEIVCQQHQLHLLAVRWGQWSDPSHPGAFRWCPSPPHLQRLLSSCSQLVELNLYYCTLKVQELQVLLNGGRWLRRVEVREVLVDDPLHHPTECQWECLTLRSGRLQQVAYLPLHSFETAKIGSYQAGTLSLPRGHIPLAEITSLLSKAATNLSQSPTWQRQPQTQPATITLVCASSQLEGLSMRSSPFSLAPLIEAVAPLGDHPQAISFCIDLPVQGLELSEGDIEALRCSFGSKLVKLRFGCISLHGSIWAALTSRLHALRSLELLYSVSLQLSDVMDYCQRTGRSPPRFVWKIAQTVCREPASCLVLLKSP